MPKYARFDPSQPAPQPVTGWYNTELLVYPHLPPAETLLELSDAEWESHWKNPESGWSVQDGRLVGREIEAPQPHPQPPQPKEMPA